MILGKRRQKPWKERQPKKAEEFKIKHKNKDDTIGKENVRREADLIKKMKIKRENKNYIKNRRG